MGQTHEQVSGSGEATRREVGRADAHGAPVTFVEPFWLASFAILVHRSRLRETGEDLRSWFLRLTQAR